MLSIAIMLAMGSTMAHAETGTAANDIFIVHGALVDGSGWRGVYDILSGQPSFGCERCLNHAPQDLRLGGIHCH